MSVADVHAILAEIESTHQVHILLAVEIGSHAWGYATPDSDRDVRFVFRRAAKDYLRVIEAPRQLSLSAQCVDAQGIDIHQFLRQLSQHRATDMLRWLTSSMVYKELHGFRHAVCQTAAGFHWSDIFVHQCLGNARSHWSRVAQEPTASYKMYIYVLRALCAASYIVNREEDPNAIGMNQPALTYSPDPARWYEYLPELERNAFTQLIALRTSSDFTRSWSGAHVDVLHSRIESSLASLQAWCQQRMETNLIAQRAILDDVTGYRIDRYGTYANSLAWDDLLQMIVCD